MRTLESFTKHQAPANKTLKRQVSAVPGCPGLDAASAPPALLAPRRRALEEVAKELQSSGPAQGFGDVLGLRILGWILQRCGQSCGKCRAERGKPGQSG